MLLRHASLDFNTTALDQVRYISKFVLYIRDGSDTAVAKAFLSKTDFF